MMRAPWARVGMAVAALGIACRSHDGRGVEQNGISARAAFAAQPIVAGDSAGATMSAYITLDNARGADTIDAMSTPIAARAAVHAEMQHGGMAMMMPAEVVEVPGHGTLRLSPGGRHLMLEGLTSRPRAGETITVTLRLRHAGNVVVQIPVISYASLDSAAAANRR